ncbi:hypothetical protein IWW34DRAFT_235990 [Fusarium oxysporum f. sp. albedinis]|nr:hypothetical protein IWW34DRAFT_235990 [Fusarium oxysporum f. sp. albedinis]
MASWYQGWDIPKPLLLLSLVTVSRGLTEAASGRPHHEAFVVGTPSVNPVTNVDQTMRARMRAGIVQTATDGKWPPGRGHRGWREKQSSCHVKRCGCSLLCPFPSGLVYITLVTKCELPTCSGRRSVYTYRV